MATAELINPDLSRSESTDSSPTESGPPQRRTTLLRQQLSLDIPDQNRALLSSSLPSPISKKELSFLKAIHQNEKNKRQKFKESKESLSQSMEIAEPGEAESSSSKSSKHGVLQRSLSTTQETSRMRPRSASLFSPDRNERGSAKRKSLRGLSRSRPSSAKLGRSRSRADSANPEEASTEKVETIMANIKTQLTQLSEEDQVLQERMNKLTEGINLLISAYLRKRCAPQQLNTPAMQCTRSVSSGTPRKPGKAVHWKDMETATKGDKALSSESEVSLSASCPMPLPTLTLSTSNNEINLLLSDEEEKSIEKDTSKHKILKLNGGLESCSLTDSPPPVCTIVIEEPDGHMIHCHTPSEEPDSQLINCHTPSSIADDEVFVL